MHLGALGKDKNFEKPIAFDIRLLVPGPQEPSVSEEKTIASFIQHANSTMTFYV